VFIALTGPCDVLVISRRMVAAEIRAVNCLHCATYKCIVAAHITNVINPTYRPHQASCRK